MRMMAQQNLNRSSQNISCNYNFRKKNLFIGDEMIPMAETVKRLAHRKHQIDVLQKMNGTVEDN